MFVVNVEGVMRKDNKWLIIERSKIEEYAGGLLSLVGGKVDKEGNSSDILERSIKREIWEEVGVRVKNNSKYIHCTSFTTDSGVNVINFVFYANINQVRHFLKVLTRLNSYYSSLRKNY